MSAELTQEVLNKVAELQARLAFVDKLVTDKLMDEILSLKLSVHGVVRDMQKVGAMLEGMQAQIEGGGTGDVMRGSGSELSEIEDE